MAGLKIYPQLIRNYSSDDLMRSWNNLIRLLQQRDRVPVQPSDVYGEIRTVTADYDIERSVGLVLVDATSAAVTVSLPLASETPSRVISVKKVDSGSNAVILDAQGSETIDGAGTSSTTTQWNTTRVQTNGYDWFKL